MYERITRETLAELIKVEDSLCLSLYMSTHRTFPERTQDPIRYKNLIRHLHRELSQRYPDADDEALMAPFDRLLGDQDFWIFQEDGLAVLGGEQFFKVYLLQRPVPDLTMIGDRPYVKPLLRIAQSADRYQVLGISRDGVRLYEGNRDVLDEVMLAPDVPRNQEQALGTELTPRDQTGHSDGHNAAGDRGRYTHEAAGAGKQAEEELDRDRYFRAVDRAITEHHSKPSGLPLVLTALPKNQAFFRAISRNSQLVDQGITADPVALTLDELRQRSWEVMSRYYINRLEGLVAQYHESHGQGLATDQIDDMAQASLNGRVQTLLVEADRIVPGRIDGETGHILSANGNQAPEDSDLLDELILLAMKQGGDVIAVPGNAMPSSTGAAALYRF